jgi:hypothetical protein
MPYCRRCGEKVDEDAASCPRCGERFPGKETQWRNFHTQDEIERAQYKANMCIILATILVTIGFVGGGVLCDASSPYGLFGIVLVCLGVACTSAAGRWKHKASTFKRELNQPG